MAFCQVYDMDIVTHTCSVRCIVIVTENAQTFQFTHSYLCNVGNQVVRDTLRILADEAALMSTNGVEIAEKQDVPLRICGMKIGQNLLQHALGTAVGVCHLTLRTLFGDGYESRIAVYGCGGTEDQVLHTMISHNITEVEGSGHVVVVIFQGL